MLVIAKRDWTFGNIKAGEHVLANIESSFGDEYIFVRIRRTRHSKILATLIYKTVQEFYDDWGDIEYEAGVKSIFISGGDDRRIEIVCNSSVGATKIVQDIREKYKLTEEK